jgi:hypothetical protein
VSNLVKSCGDDLYRCWDVGVSRDVATYRQAPTASLRIGLRPSQLGFTLQLCISSFTYGKYDFTSQFIWLKYK